MEKDKIRKWLVEQKFTLIRGYGWAQVPVLGFIFASSVKQVLPGLFDTFLKFILLVIVGFFGLWFLGYLDKRYRFLHAENTYSSETNPVMMDILKSAKEKNGNKEVE